MCRKRLGALGSVVTAGMWATSVGALVFLTAAGCTSTASREVGPGRDGGSSGSAGDGGRGVTGGNAGVGAVGSGARGGSGGAGNGNGLGDAGAGLGDAGAGIGAGECEPNVTEPCWETEDGEPLPDPPKEVRGDCRFGVRTCSASGTWSACVGAVPPADEDSCKPGADENCNGEPNEGCPCTDGETRACGLATGNCEEGSQRCENSAWTACEGGVTPAAQDSCAVVGDDADCDGVPNRGCPCVGAATEACEECGERTCQPEARDWGACEPTTQTETCWETEAGEPLSGSATDMGNCSQGTRTCAVGGKFGACVGALGPASKDACNVAGDDATCDGVPNGGCPCTGTQTRACGSDVGSCERGTQSCVSGAWGECGGGVEPAAQDGCAVVGDDANCNGVPNEGCPCIGSQTQACNDCGTRTCDPSKRTWGACKPSSSPPATRCGTGAVLQTCDSAGRWASTPCTTTDTHCAPGCAIGGDGKAACTVEAKDADGDTYADALCATAPGNDCDDARVSVYPGAREICDGIDNDCDGKVDLRDGLTLDGTNVTTPDRHTWDIAYHPSGYFGMVGNGSTWGIFFGDIAVQQGTVTFDSTTFVPTSSDYSRARLAFSPTPVTSDPSGGYGVVYDEGNKGGVSIRWQAIASNGDPGPNVYSTGGVQNAAIATLANNDFAVSFSNGSAVHFARLRPSVGFSNATSIAESARTTRIATNGNQSAIVYELGTANTIKWVRASTAYALGSSQQLSTAGHNPDITRTPSGYAIAWSTASGVAMSLYTADGARVCGPTNAPFGNGSLETNDAVAIEQTAYGTVVFAIDQGGEMRIFRFNGSCQLLDDQAVLPTPATPSVPNMAVGGNTLVISWNEGREGRFRILNEKLCP